jgi:hypothetical protein
LPIFGSIIFYALLLGQGSEDGVFFLRIFSYFSAPVLLSHHLNIYEENHFVYSFIEFFIWPILSLMGSPINQTVYEYEFIQLPNGLSMNVLIPSYAALGNIIDFMSFAFISIATLMIINNKIANNSKLNQCVNFNDIAIIGIFGPISLLINPFLGEKAFWFFLIIVFGMSYLMKQKYRNKILIN